ncbi:MAG: methyltransferase domain-containing protein [Acidobacteriota bacterium]
MSPDPPLWREFTYPLNVFMHILTREAGSVSWLHYGLFDSADDSLAEAQERSTRLLFSRLPPAPARLLEVGIGLGTTLRRMIDAGYDAVGITPDEKQVALVRARDGDAWPVHCVRFEDFRAPGPDPYDVIVFQESSQYIDSEALFARAATLAPRIVVLDEFALRPIDEEGALHSWDAFLEAAARHGFTVTEELDLSERAAPTMDYFTERIPASRDRLIADLSLSGQQVDELITSGSRYRARYADGTYGYRLVCFLRIAAP